MSKYNMLIEFGFLIEKALQKMKENNEEAMCKIPICMVVECIV